MLTRMTLAAAALAVASPALANCIEYREGVQCDLFLEEYRSDEVPVGTTMIWPERSFAIENFSPPGFQEDSRLGRDDFGSDNVFVRNGDDSFIVPGVSGPPIKIADF